ncbi:MAG: FkbM family methyltransferase, partial [Sediminibacterium sp.]
IPVYDLQTIAVIHRLPKDAVCIDIGVNEGQLFNSMFKQCPEGTLYGFEPIPHLYKYLSSKYNADRVHLHQMVLSDTEEDTSFFYFPKRTGVSGLSKRGEMFTELQSVELHYRTTPLDKVLELSRIDLIKIDVEGAELRVLRGARENIMRCKPIIVFECGYGGIDYYKGTPEDVFEFFDGVGYGISLLKYQLAGLPPLDRHSFIHLFKHGYEYQYIAYPAPVAEPA